MSSFKARIKDFVFNQVLTKMPGWFLYFVYSKVLLPKAQADILAIKDLYLRDFTQQKNTTESTVSHRTALPLVVGMVGLPQEGKTVLASAIAAEGGFLRIDSNLVRNWLIDTGRNYANIDAIILNMLEDALSGGPNGTQDEIKGRPMNVVLDSDNVLPVKRTFISAVANRYHANVQYVRVSAPFAQWKSRLSFTVFKINRMYIDGVRRSRNISADSLDLIPPEHIMDLVKQEHDRQLPGHVSYLPSVDLFSGILNIGKEEDLRGRGRFTARELLSIYGDGKTRREIEERFGVVDARRKK